MVLWLCEGLAIAIFLWKATSAGVRRALPIMLTASFLRFLEHYIAIDWFHLWGTTVKGFLSFVMPVTADLTIWPIAAYMFIQLCPSSRRPLYIAMWTLFMVAYLKLLLWANIVTMPHWNLALSTIVIAVYWSVLFGMARALGILPGGVQATPGTDH